MPDLPYTIRDGALDYEDDGDWTVVEPLACGLLAEDVPCLVVTGDLVAARARLAEPSGDTRQRARDVVEAIARRRMVEVGFANGPAAAPHLADLAVDALAAAGLLREPAEPTNAQIMRAARAMRDLMPAMTSPHSERLARAALLAAAEASDA